MGLVISIYEAMNIFLDNWKIREVDKDRHVIRLRF